MNELMTTTIYLLALVNPVSKIFILTTLSDQADRREMRRLSIMSSLVGLLILLSFALGGKLLLTQVFHTEVYSLQLVGGVVLFVIGFRALTRGVFFEVDANAKLSEVSIVPLASPMIAGPATITAALTLTINSGFGLTCAASTLAIGANLVVMLLSEPIGRVLRKFNLMGALIRITGLFVATLAAQMVFDGVSAWLRQM